MKIQKYGVFHPSTGVYSGLPIVDPELGKHCLEALQDYRKNRENENGSGSLVSIDFPGDEFMEILYAIPVEDRWPAKPIQESGCRMYWWKRPYSEIEPDFYCQPDNTRGYPDNDGRYWFSIHRKSTGSKIDGFSQEPNYEKGFPDLNQMYWYTIKYTECGKIKRWMQEKDRIFLNGLEEKKHKDAVLQLYNRLNNCLDICSEAVWIESISLSTLATGNKIGLWLKALLGKNVHVVDPDLLTFSPTSSSKEERLLGALDYANVIKEHFLIQGELTKPIVMVFNKHSNDKIFHTETVCHWQLCVILPVGYQPFIEGLSQVDQTCIYFIDSLNSDEKFPFELKDSLRLDDGSQIGEVVSNVFLDAKIINRSPLQQVDCYDCGWWCVYNAFMLLCTGNDNYLGRFTVRSRLFSNVLREEWDLTDDELTEDASFSPKEASEISGSLYQVEEFDKTSNLIKINFTKEVEEEIIKKNDKLMAERHELSTIKKTLEDLRKKLIEKEVIDVNERNKLRELSNRHESLESDIREIESTIEPLRRQKDEAFFLENLIADKRIDCFYNTICSRMRNFFLAASAINSGMVSMTARHSHLDDVNELFSIIGNITEALLTIAPFGDKVIGAGKLVRSVVDAIRLIKKVSEHGRTAVNMGRSAIKHGDKVIKMLDNHNMATPLIKYWFAMKEVLGLQDIKIGEMGDFITSNDFQDRLIGRLACLLAIRYRELIQTCFVEDDMKGPKDLAICAVKRICGSLLLGSATDEKGFIKQCIYAVTLFEQHTLLGAKEFSLKITNLSFGKKIEKENITEKDIFYRSGIRRWLDTASCLLYTEGKGSLPIGYRLCLPEFDNEVTFLKFNCIRSEVAQEIENCIFPVLPFVLPLSELEQEQSISFGSFLEETQTRYSDMLRVIKFQAQEIDSLKERISRQEEIIKGFSLKIDEINSLEKEKEKRSSINRYAFNTPGHKTITNSGSTQK